MSSKIRVLDEHTINKIAAGEVIENPSSVVKEMIENAIDAGATDICIEIKGGGRQLIRITDNGCGMSSDDALLCLERHATSKIRDIDDIHAIMTMGFRGEAIPSIASISKFTILTCLKDAEKGTMVVVDGGKVVQCSPVARSPGTTIEVKSLFFNVPARKKFQKSPAYDANEIAKVINTVALGYPEIKFQLISDHKTVITTHLIDPQNTFEQTFKQRVHEILGADFASSTCSIHSQDEDFCLQGVIGLPTYTRHNRTGQFLFINKRPVFSPVVAYAVREGYGTALLSNRHPVYILHLTMPGSYVDVNVHPQKKEVRLRQEPVLKEMIMKAVRNSLKQCDVTIPVPNLETVSFDFFPSSYAPKITFSQDFFVEQPVNVREESVPIAMPMQSFEASPSFRLPQKEEALELKFSSTQNSVPPRVLATINRYIIIDVSMVKDKRLPIPTSSEGLCLVDQKAAHSRVIFEKLLLTEKNMSIPIQALLIPYTFETTAMESELLIEQQSRLNQMGISIRQMGPSTFVIDALPQIFGNSDLSILISDLIHGLNEDSNLDKGMHAKRIAATASRSAVSKKLSFDEAQSLVNQLMKCETPYLCPLGKPTLIYLTQEELSKRFSY